ncbi:MAG: hypothetical protein PHQ80_01045 [Candidatus ainarchaeum sp.]|nr:hypothetical protein [Candidatus ainarchaeum sp.]MDD5095983.1 hypothetical protein [Candidatus ainarchaeum sp.]
MSWATGLGSWFGELLLFFGIFSLIGSGQFLLAGIGAIMVFMFEGLAVGEKPAGNEMKELAEFPAAAIKNLFFPALWLVLFFLNENGFILAFAIATGVKAVALNAKLLAKAFLWADGKTL